MRNTQEISDGKYQGKRLLGRSECRCKDVTMFPGERGCEGGDKVQVAQDSVRVFIFLRRLGLAGQFSC
jgi:hypothetical protein